MSLNVIIADITPDNKMCSSFYTHTCSDISIYYSIYLKPLLLLFNVVGTPGGKKNIQIFPNKIDDKRIDKILINKINSMSGKEGEKIL